MVREMTKLERLLAALYVSEGWYETFNTQFFEKNKRNKRYGLYAKMRCVIIYDRIMSGRTEWYKQ